jgi:hypothetical protein
MTIGPDGGTVEAARWTGGRNETLLLLPRASYEVFYVDVPPVRPERLEEALPWRIRAFYPGPAESTRIDHRAVPGDPSRRLVFATDMKTLSTLENAAPGAALVPAALLEPRTPRPGPWRAAVWTGAGIELLRFEGPIFVSSRHVEGTLESLRSALRDLPAAETDVPLSVILTRDAGEDRDSAAAVAGGLPGSPPILTLEEFAERPRGASSAVFAPPAVGPVRVRKALATAALILALVLAARIPGRTAELRRSRLEAVKAEYEAARSRSSRAAELAAELDRLEARRLELEVSARPDAYRILADLSACSGQGVRLFGLVLEGTELRLEAEGPDALSLLGGMRDSGRFENVELRQSVVLPGGGERYVLTARARP